MSWATETEPGVSTVFIIIVIVMRGREGGGGGMGRGCQERGLCLFEGKGSDFSIAPVGLPRQNLECQQFLLSLSS